MLANRLIIVDNSIIRVRVCVYACMRVCVCVVISSNIVLSLNFCTITLLRFLALVFVACYFTDTTFPSVSFLLIFKTPKIRSSLRFSLLTLIIYHSFFENAKFARFYALFFVLVVSCKCVFVYFTRNTLLSPPTSTRNVVGFFMLFGMGACPLYFFSF